MFSRDKSSYEHVRIEKAGDSRYRLARLTEDASTIVDVGCAVGYIGEFLKRTRTHRWLAGIEIDPIAAERARPYYDQLIVGSIEDEAVWAKLPPGISAMIFGDVLEHTSDPVRVLRLARGVLADDGRIVVSIPNVAFFAIRLRLFLGRFDYEESGIMDRTHLRFFTRRTCQLMFHEAGYRITRTEGAGVGPPSERPPTLKRVLYAVRARTEESLIRFWPALFAYQFIWVAQKAQPT